MIQGSQGHRVDRQGCLSNGLSQLTHSLAERAQTGSGGQVYDLRLDARLDGGGVLADDPSSAPFSRIALLQQIAGRVTK